MLKKYIGIDIGGTKCAVVLGTEQGEILDKECIPTDHTNAPTGMLEKIFGAVERHISPEVVGIGISCGGPLDCGRGIILSPPNLPGWDAVPITDLIYKRFRIPARLQNDANACAIAEWKHGAGKGCENLAFLTFGTGLGAGLILNNRIYEGHNGNAGELGHIRLETMGPVGFGKCGSFEGLCSGSGIAQLAQSHALACIQQGRTAAYCGSTQTLSQITARSVAEAAGNGDATACRVYEEVGRYLGKGLAILMDMLNPDIVIIGGVFMRSGHLMRASMEEAIGQEALASCVCPVVAAELGERIGDFGALCVARGVGTHEGT